MKIQIGGLTTKHLFVDFLQQAVHYFEGLKKKKLFHVIQTNEQTNSSKQTVDSFTDR